MRYKKNQNPFLVLLVFAFIVCSCEDEAIANLLGTSAQSPVYTGCKVLSGTQVDFMFSTGVRLVSARFQPDVELSAAANGSKVSVTMKDDHSGGERFIADLLVEDSEGNSLGVLVPFRTRNDRVPKFIINEIRVEYSKPRSEFIELKMQNDGNLGALRLFVTSAVADTPVYEFPPVEVKRGDYVLLHLRTLATDNAVDELENNLALASAGKEADSPRTVRDLWVHTDKKLVHKTDVIYIVDQDDVVVDGIVIAENANAWKKNNAFTKAAELLAKQRKWFNKDGVLVLSPQFEDAVLSAGTTVTKTICRYESRDNSRTNADWYICGSGNGSPGIANKP
ncbi:MAG: hypothetical protein Pg6A_19370 [Termitinemataceae bacterium]|nr:MAG: hypothetical protein Pg6A_19370 [Termitinemataceae bacterium]